MKVSHRSQVHVQLTGFEAALLLGVLEEFAESSRMGNLSDEQIAVVETLRAELMIEDA